MDKSAMGKKSRAAGNRFELKVRHNLEDLGWIVCKWANNVEFVGGDICHVGKLIPAKHIFNPFTKAMSSGNGFPDFIAFKKSQQGYEVIAVESKMTGVLDKKEKEKVQWLLQNKVFEVILVASKGDKRGDILYEQILLKGGKLKWTTNKN